MTKRPDENGGRDVPDGGMLALLERGQYITPTNRLMVERYKERWHLSPLYALLETHVLSESELADALAASLGIDRVYQVSQRTLAPEALEVLPFKRARAWECLVLQEGDGTLELVMADPTLCQRIQEIKQGLKRELTLSVAERSDIVKAIDELYPLSAELPSLGAPAP